MNVQPGQILLNVVPLDEVWITANFKETQLRKMKQTSRPARARKKYTGRDAKKSCLTQPQHRVEETRLSSRLLLRFLPSRHFLQLMNAVPSNALKPRITRVTTLRDCLLMYSECSASALISCRPF